MCAAHGPLGVRRREERRLVSPLLSAGNSTTAVDSHPIERARSATVARPKAKTIRITVGESRPSLEVHRVEGRRISLTIGYPDYDVVFIFPDTGPAAEWLAEGIRVGVLSIPYLEETAHA
jgi:hypothetical protein